MGYTGMNQINDVTIEKFPYSSKKDYFFQDAPERSPQNNVKIDEKRLKAFAPEGVSSIWYPSASGVLGFGDTRQMERSNSTPPHRLFEVDPPSFGFNSIGRTLGGVTNSYNTSDQKIESEEILHPGIDGRRIQRSWSAPPIRETMGPFDYSGQSVDSSLRFPPGFNGKQDHGLLSSVSEGIWSNDSVFGASSMGGSQTNSTSSSLSESVSPISSSKLSSLQGASLVDRIQEDFPRSPSPVFDPNPFEYTEQSSSFNHNKDAPFVGDLSRNFGALAFDQQRSEAEEVYRFQDSHAPRHGYHQHSHSHMNGGYPTDRATVPAFPVASHTFSSMAMDPHAMMIDAACHRWPQSIPMYGGINGSASSYGAATYAPEYPLSSSVLPSQRFFASPGVDERNVSFAPIKSSNSIGGVNSSQMPLESCSNIIEKTSQYDTVKQQHSTKYSPRTMKHEGRHGHRNHKGGSRSRQAEPVPPIAATIPTAPLAGHSYSSHSLLEEFRATCKIKRWELSTIKGHLFQFAKDQNGSRFIQQKLEISDTQVRNEAFDEIYPNAILLMSDVFGNYVIQKFFEFGTAEQKHLLVEQMKNNMLTLALQVYGCRVIQRALEKASVPDKIVLIRQLKGSALKCVTDQNGNHVLQKCIEVASYRLPSFAGKEENSASSAVPSQEIQFILDSFRGRAFDLSTHSYGCRVIQRVLEHCCLDQIKSIYEEIMYRCCELMKDQYGNYVVQHILIHGGMEERDFVMQTILPEIPKWSRHKYASNVVEICFEYSTEEQLHGIVDMILACGDESSNSNGNNNTCALLMMMKDQFANYVVQKLLDKIQSEDRARIVWIIKHNAAYLKRFTYGKHVLSRLETEIENLTFAPSSFTTGK